MQAKNPKPKAKRSSSETLFKQSAPYAERSDYGNWNWNYHFQAA
jgi:hypothetical protein